MRYIRVVFFITACTLSFASHIAICAAEGGDLAAMSIEDLMNIEVTSVSKKEQKVQDAAAAVFVLSSEDIVRSGARTLPEALRMVPGLHIARVSGHQWGVSARGGNSLFANKLLVLIDGRSVYTPLFSGIFWDVQNPMVDDIDRIEVIRGPGAALWGANAFNGVINIITKSSAHTLGGVVTSGGGSYEHGYIDTRYGARLSEAATGRLYATFSNRGTTESLIEDDAYDAWRNGQGGFRLDANEGGNAYTFQGDIYSGFSGQHVEMVSDVPPFSFDSRSHTNFSGGNILSRLQHALSDDRSIQVQLYWDRAQRDDVNAKFTYDILDFDTQYQMAIGSIHDASLGGGARIIKDELSDDRSVHFPDGSRSLQIVNAFIQDDIRLFSNTTHLILGSKFEHNQFTGFEVQPNARLLFKATDDVTMWAAYSHAVRTPSRAENDARFFSTHLPAGAVSGMDLPTLVSVVGNHQLGSEKLHAYEAGVRSAISDSMSIDLVTFINKASDIEGLETIGQELQLDGAVPYIVVTNQFTEATTLDAFGVEPVFTWRISPSWRLQAWYTFLDQNNETDPLKISSSTTANDPRHQAYVRSILDLSDTVFFDSSLRYVDKVPSFGIDAYTEVNARLAWRCMPDLEISLGGMNLLAPDHQEYGADFINIASTSIPRMIYGQVRWSF